MSEWNKCSVSPEKGDEVEVVGYYTFCCEQDAEHEVSIKRCVYDERECYTCEEGGYMILPLFWRPFPKLPIEMNSVLQS